MKGKAQELTARKERGGIARVVAMGLGDMGLEGVQTCTRYRSDRRGSIDKVSSEQYPEEEDLAIHHCWHQLEGEDKTLAIRLG